MNISEIIASYFHLKIYSDKRITAINSESISLESYLIKYEFLDKDKIVIKKFKNDEIIERTDIPKISKETICYIFIDGNCTNLNQNIAFSCLEMHINSEIQSKIDCHRFLYYIISEKVLICGEPLNIQCHRILSSEIKYGDFLHLESIENDITKHSHSVIFIGNDKNGENLFIGKLGKIGIIHVLNSNSMKDYLQGNFNISKISKIGSIGDSNFPIQKIKLS